jgi:hypothetical protein
MKLPAILILLALCFGIPTPGIADGSHDQLTEPGNLLPNNTIIIANEMDAHFSQDFSLLLRQLRLEWVILDGTVLPESVWDKNLILMGHPDAAYTGEIIRGILTAEEIDMIRAAADLHVVIEKESPWTRFLNPRYAGVVAIFLAGGSVWAYFMRKKPRVVTLIGVIWLTFGSIWMVLEPQKPIGFAGLLAGVVCLVWGGINLLKARQAPLESDG